MNESDKQLAEALRNAAEDVEAGKTHPHAVGATAGVPSWLMTILQLVGPSILAAVQKWLSTAMPNPAPPAPPAPKPGTNA